MNCRPGAGVSSQFATGALWQEEHAEQEPEEEPSRKHDGDLGRSQPGGKARALLDLSQESFPFRIVI